MKLRVITFSGADDSIDPRELQSFLDVPQVEWGILLHRVREGEPKYPSPHWLEKLRRTHVERNFPRLSLHLCGAFVREVLEGECRVATERRLLFQAFDRVQLNLHGRKVPECGFPDLLREHPDKQWIFQVDGTNNGAYEVHRRAGINAVPFFDQSGGRGVKVGELATPYDDVLNGYTGGLGPHNLKRFLLRLDKHVGDREVWVDLETHLRSDDGSRFDLEKVRRCLDVASVYF